MVMLIVLFSVVECVRVGALLLYVIRISSGDIKLGVFDEEN